MRCGFTSGSASRRPMKASSSHCPDISEIDRLSFAGADRPLRSRRIAMPTSPTPRQTGRGVRSAGRRLRIVLALVALAVAGAPPTLAATPAEQAADDLNAAVLKTYRQAKAVRLAQTSPVIVVSFDQLVMIRDGSERRVDFTPRAY